MTNHLTARLAWHDDGWNGRICERPECNTYCVGAHSYPGDVVGRERDLAKEQSQAGKQVAELRGQDLPPCIYSVNAFGQNSIKGYSNPRDFFRGGAKRTEWDIPQSTVCVWPYEAMYGDDVSDARKRVEPRLRAWELSAALALGFRRFEFEYERAKYSPSSSGAARGQAVASV